MTTQTQTQPAGNPFFSGTTPATVASASAVTVKVTKRMVPLVQKQQQRDSEPPRVHPMAKSLDELADASAPLPTAAVTATKKKRQSTSPPVAGPSKVQKTKSAGSVKAKASASARSSRASSRAKDTPEPTFIEHIYRSSGGSSRSASSLPVSLDAPVPRHVSISKPAKMGDILSSEIVVKRLMKSYEAYFRNPDDPNDRSFEVHETKYPRVELAYPATGVSEKFILLAPKDPDHYNPIMCLESTVHVLVKSYLTPEQQNMFGYVPDDLFLDDVPHSGAISRTASSSSSPPPSSPISKISTSPLSSISIISSKSSSSTLTTLSSSSSPPPNLLRTLRRAINTRNGPLFVSTIDAINRLLSSLKHPIFSLDSHWGADDPPPGNAVSAAATRWDGEGLPRPIMLRIIEETYQRAVGPNVRALRKYAAFSSEVYGELTPTFVSELVQIAALKPGKLLLDLGSGVANVVIQAALEAGCDTYGIEINPEPARVAREHAAQFAERCKMWSVNAGTVELEEGDMLKSARVDELMSKADVVLVNNKVFLESLNEALRPKFLDLKEGALLISLKPFVPPNTRITERNVDDMSAIFDVTERTYSSGAVSWGSGSGVYYVHRVDRTGYAAVRERFERSQPSRRASSRKYTPSHLDD